MLSEYLKKDGAERESDRQRLLLKERAKKGNRLGEEELVGGMRSRPCWRGLSKPVSSMG